MTKKKDKEAVAKFMKMTERKVPVGAQAELRKVTKEIAEYARNFERFFDISQATIPISQISSQICSKCDKLNFTKEEREQIYAALNIMITIHKSICTGDGEISDNLRSAERALKKILEYKPI